jgi:DNA polymerase-1
MERPEPYRLLDSWPDIRDQKLIGYDVETEDLGIQNEKGPGAFRGEGKLLGVGIYTEKFEHYFPIGHEDGQNYDRVRVVNYLNDMLATDIPKVGANIPYDMEWSFVTGIHIRGPIRDIQIAEPMLDEERPGGYSLDRLALDYLGVGKDETLLKAAMQHYGIAYKKDKEIKQHLKRFAPEWVAPYCITDAKRSVEVYLKQIPKLREEDLWDLFMLECELIPIFHEMKKFGVRVDVKRAEELKESLDKEEADLINKIRSTSGLAIDIWSGPDIEKYFIEKGLEYKKTKPSKRNPEGNASFTGDFLANHEDPVCKMIAEARKINTMNVRYVEDILKYEHKGRLHSVIHQMASDDKEDDGKEQVGGKYGTRSGRISYSHLNLQKIPKRDKKWKTIIRSMFLPEEGCFWGQKDYSQQEPRLGVHYAYRRNMPGAAEAVEYYKQPGACFHTMVAEMAQIDRNTKAKPLNLGSWYGMGLEKMLIDLGGDTPFNREVYAAYHKRFPFVRALLKDCMKFAEKRGYVKTILGRRAHFKSVVPLISWDERMERHRAKAGFKYKPVREEKVDEHIQYLKDELEKLKYEPEPDPDKLEELSDTIAAWERGRFERVATYKALNRVIQGGAADQTKKSIRDIYRYFGHVRYTQIQVHDELDGSYENTEDLWTACQIMEDAIQLVVPVVVEPEVGPSWGQTTKLDRTL